MLRTTTWGNTMGRSCQRALSVEELTGTTIALELALGKHTFTFKAAHPYGNLRTLWIARQMTTPRTMLRCRGMPVGTSPPLPNTPAEWWTFSPTFFWALGSPFQSLGFSSNSWQAKSKGTTKGWGNWKSTWRKTRHAMRSVGGRLKSCWKTGAWTCKSYTTS